jgi:hypothetical protein
VDRFSKDNVAQLMLDTVAIVQQLEETAGQPYAPVIGK